MWKDSVLLLLLPPVILVLLSVRIHYGIDFTDESFYVALAYRFAMGDQPFVDEYNLAQVSGALLSPFVSVFLYFHNGQPDGVVLFVRYLHLVFSALVSTIVFFALRRYVSSTFALLASLLAIVFTPLGLHSISYITLGSGFFTIGCFLGLWSLRHRQIRRLSLFSGVAHGLAVISYPTLIIPSVFFLGVLTIWCHTGARLRHAAHFIAGAVVVGMIPAILLIQAGYQNVATAIAYVLSFGPQGEGAQRILDGAWMIWDNFPHKDAVLLGLGALVALSRTSKNWAYQWLFVAAAIIPLALVTSKNLWTPNALPLESLYLVINLALIAPVFIWMLWHRESTRHLFHLVWVPSFVAGLVVFWSSGNGARMAAIGMLPGAIVGLVLLASTLAGRDADRPQSPAEHTIRGSLIIALVLCVFLANQFVGLYRDEPLQNLQANIEAGPYQGIFTTRERDTFIRMLSADIGAIAKRDEKILFFDDFPAGYLMSTLRPATPAVWLNPSSAYPTIDRMINEKYYAHRGIEPDVVVKLKKVPLLPDHPGLQYPDNDPLIVFVNARYMKTVDRAEYEIYVKNERGLANRANGSSDRSADRLIHTPEKF